MKTKKILLLKNMIVNQNHCTRGQVVDAPEQDANYLINGGRATEDLDFLKKKAKADADAKAKAEAQAEAEKDTKKAK